MSPAPLSSAAARSAAMPLPMTRKVEGISRNVQPLPLLLSYHPRFMPPPAATPAVRLDVRTPSGSYPVEIAPGLAARAGAALDAAGVPRRRFVVSSMQVWRLHGERFAAITPEQPILIPDGERFKNAATVGRIYDALIRAQADRGCAIVAVGGGVTGDVAGFAAATFLRGIPVAQVPTTLLAQVDSAMGGKVELALREAEQNKGRAAELLGISFKALLAKLKEYRIE